MFDESYKKSMDNVKPDELLIKKTKNAMHKEIKKKPTSFYKYAAAAACLIITFSLFRITFDSLDNSVSTTDTMIGNISDKNSENPPNSFSAPGIVLPNSGNFTQAGSSQNINEYFADAQVDSLSSQDNIFVRTIKSVINWFKNLF